MFIERLTLLFLLSIFLFLKIYKIESNIINEKIDNYIHYINIV